MIDEEFQHIHMLGQDRKDKIATAVRNMTLCPNKQGRFCTLYLLAKAKSVAVGKWIWRGILRLPAFVLNCQDLRLGARA